MSRAASRTAPPTASRSSARHVSRNAPQQVRIIGGDWKRTPLQVLDADGLRPTPDRVRETLFNWLGQAIEGAACVDLFAGTGALGFEAASRGARRVLMIERNGRAAMQLKAVKGKLEAGMVEVVEADALRLGASLAANSFDVVFLDPPFDSTILPKALAVAARLSTDDGFIYVEAPGPLERPEPQTGRVPEPTNPDLLAAFADLHAEGWRVWRQGKAGAVFYHLLRRETGE